MVGAIKHYDKHIKYKNIGPRNASECWRIIERSGKIHSP